MPYFTIMAELRGCYADNESAFTIKADSRKVLKSFVEGEVSDLRDAGAVGLNNRDVASLVANTWRNRKTAHGKPLYPFVLPFRYSHHSPGNNCMGLFIYVSDRETYEQCMERD